MASAGSWDRLPSAFVAAVFIGGLKPPPLLYAEVVEAGEGVSALETSRAWQSSGPAKQMEDVQAERGRLVAHADGYWYVLKRDGDLLNIPESGQQVVVLREYEPCDRRP